MSNYTAGNNVFPILVTDISGAAVEGISSGWSVYGQVGTNIITSAVNITESISGSGWYLGTINLPVGQGFIEFTHSNPLYNIAGAYDVSVGVYDSDDIYSQVSRQTLDFTQTSIGVYESQDIGPFKEGDDWDFSYIIPDSVTPDISGYTNFKASLFTDEALVTEVISGANYLGDFTLTIDVPTKTVRMVAPNTITTSIVPQGSTETILYSDLQCIDTNGYKKTLAEFSITVRRQFTKG